MYCDNQTALFALYMISCDPREDESKIGCYFICEKLLFKKIGVCQF